MPELKRRRRKKTNQSEAYALSAKDRQVVIALIVFTVLFAAVTIIAVWNFPELQDDNNSNVMLGEDGVMMRLSGGKTTTRRKRYRSYDLQHTFPVHVGSDMETIAHPGVQFSKVAKQLYGSDFKLTVPKFWSPSEYGPDGIRAYLGEYGKHLLTPKQAESVGSFASIGGRKELPTIFVAVASYCDPQCSPTLESIYARAKYPERIRVGVVEQLFEGSESLCSNPTPSCDTNPQQAFCQYRHLMEFHRMNAKYAVGPVFARHLGNRMYRGEYFALQVDSHVRFTQDWDEDLIEQWESANNEYAVLSVYLSELTKSIDPKTHKSKRKSRPLMCDSDFEDEGVYRHLRHGQEPEELPFIHGEPQLHPYWAAGFSFARGHFVVQVPYDQYLPLVFQGEEISMGLRAFTYGYDFYAPERSVCFHMYELKKYPPKYWEHDEDFEPADIVSMKRLNGIIGMGQPGNENYYSKGEKLYGLGHIRTTEKFFKTFGIHIENQTVEHHLCDFVEEVMTPLFKQHLRKNKMGIDYDRITFEYVDPRPNDTPAPTVAEYEYVESESEEKE